MVDPDAPPKHAGKVWVHWILYGVKVGSKANKIFDLMNKVHKPGITRGVQADFILKGNSLFCVACVVGRVIIVKKPYPFERMWVQYDFSIM